MTLGTPASDATRTAVLLAVLPPTELETPEQWSRFRVVTGSHGNLNLRKRYEIGRTVTREAVRLLLERDDLADGASFELVADLLGMKELLVGLLHPSVAAIARAARAGGVSEADIRAELKGAGVDLDERKIDGLPWTKLEHAMKHSYFPWTVVEKVTAPYGEISLETSRLLDPGIALGHELRFPSLDRTSCPDLIALFADDDSAPLIDGRNAESFERLLPTVRPVAVPKVLAKLGLGPLRPLYPEGHGVLYVDEPGSNAFAVWQKLDAAAAHTGFRPVLLGGDERELREGQGAWRLDPLEGLQAGAHPNDSPANVLAAAETVDVRALLADGGNPSYPDELPQGGEWPAGPSSDRIGALHDPLSKELHARVRIALVPVEAAWKTIAFLPMLNQAGEATPSMAQACAVSREWEERFGAKVVSVRPAAIEWWVERPPSRGEAALEIARAHFNFTPEGGSMVLEERANELVSSVWSSWWD